MRKRGREREIERSEKEREREREREGECNGWCQHQRTQLRRQSDIPAK